MIMCDFCLGFYHTDCIGIDDEFATSIETYKCNDCLTKGTSVPMYEEGKQLRIYHCKTF